MSSNIGQRGASIIAILLVTVAVCAGFLIGQHIMLVRKSAQDIVDYAQCIKARGAKLLQTYPEQCVADGKVFTNPAQVIKDNIPSNK